MQKFYVTYVGEGKNLSEIKSACGEIVLDDENEEDKEVEASEDLFESTTSPFKSSSSKRVNSDFQESVKSKRMVLEKDSEMLNSSALCPETSSNSKDQSMHSLTDVSDLEGKIIYYLRTNKQFIRAST